MPSLPVVIIQSAPAHYAASSLAPISPTSSTYLSSASDRSSYISSTGSNSSDDSYNNHASTTRPAQVTARTPHGQQDFVYTGRPQGGNPNGGPSQMQGYERVSTGNVTVHNTGGRVRGLNVVTLGAQYGNDRSHTKECRESSRKSDSVGLCFCPPGRN